LRFLARKKWVTVSLDQTTFISNLNLYIAFFRLVKSKTEAEYTQYKSQNWLGLTKP